MMLVLVKLCIQQLYKINVSNKQRVYQISLGISHLSLSSFCHFLPLFSPLRQLTIFFLSLSQLFGREHAQPPSDRCFLTAFQPQHSNLDIFSDFYISSTFKRAKSSRRVYNKKKKSSDFSFHSSRCFFFLLKI